MIYCLLISRIFLSPVSLFFMMAGSLAQVSSICSSWESDHDFENNQDQSIILWEKNELPFIDCPLYCGMDHSCRSFFYHPSLEKCLGSKSYKRGLPDNQAMQQGWNYYTRPQHCDGGYIYNATLAVCYKFHNTDWANYSNAMDVCETEEAKLLIITNDDQLQYFRKISLDYYIWIGLRRSIDNTAWRWWNGQTVSKIPVGSDMGTGFSNKSCVYLFYGMYVQSDPSATYSFLCQRHI